MKRSFLLLFFIIISVGIYSQAKYYEGEWMRINTTSQFLALMKLEMNGSNVEGTIFWKFLVADSSNASQVSFYSGKKYQVGVEYVRGSYNSNKSDVHFTGYMKDDPLDVIGVDEYWMKYCMDWKVLYGKTWSNGRNDGLVYFKEISDEEGKKREDEFRKKMSN